MKNTWLVRPNPHEIKRIDEFRTQEIIAVGWPGIGDLTGKSREDIKQILIGKPYELSGLSLGNAYPQLDFFVNKIKIGDIVLVPNGADILLGEITSEYYMEPQYDSMEVGYSHQHKVKWLRTVSRNDLSQHLRTSLKVRRSVADLTKHSEEISALAHGISYEPQTNQNEVITVSYPLRRDFMIHFELPANITKEEAKRLAQHFETLYFTE